MRYSKSAIITLLFCFIQFNSLSAQQLGELRIQPVPEGEGITYIVRTPGVAILIVHSTIPQLSFENNMGIIHVDNPDPGEYRVHLPPGTNIVTFKASGYLPAKEMFYIEEKRCKEVRLSAKHEPVTANRPEITLRYTPESTDERILGSIDGNVLHLNFISGTVVLRPPSGRHVVKLNNGGRVWEKTFMLKDNQKVEEDVIFPEMQTESAISEEPGSLFITSEPTGAMVYMNELQQGPTPLTLEGVQPGRYEIDIIRPLYVPEHIVVEIKPLDYSTHHIKLTSNFGKLRIESEPPSATIYLNGEERGQTPLDLQQLNAGNQHIRLVKSFYHDEEDDLKIAPGDSIVRNYVLKPKFGQLMITSEPSNADVIIDGVELGTTPMQLDTLASGSHVITIQLNHYHESVDQIRINDGDELTRHYDLKGNFGLLSVLTDPSQATVYINGKEIDTLNAPIEDMMLDPGEYSIRIEKEDYETYETNIMIALEANEILEPVLIRKTGRLKISSEPQLVDIYLNDKQYGQTPTVLHDLPTGTYTLRLEKHEYDPIEEQIIIKHRNITDVHRTLSTVGYKAWSARRNKARILSVLPGAGQFVSGQKLRGVAYASGFLIFTISAIDARVNHNDYKDKYKSYQESYHDAETDSEIRHYFNSTAQAHDNMNKAEDNMNSFLLLMVGVYAIQIADAWIWGGGSPPQPGKSEYSYKKLKAESYFHIDRSSIRVEIGFRFGGGR